MTPARIVVTQDDAIVAMTDKTKRTFVPIRKTFVQQGTGKVRAPGPAGALCTNRDERGLDLYLLVHMVTSGDDFTTTMDAAGWARGLGLSPTPNGLAAVSKAFARLETHGLLLRGRSGNRGRYTLLDESGSGAAYVHPAGRKEPYLKLPHAYWTDRWHHRLSLTGKTLLLIALSLSPDFVLPRSMGPAWYGLSPATVQSGLADLVDHGALTVRTLTKKAPLTTAGITTEYRYTHAGIFAQKTTSTGRKIIPITKVVG